MCVLFNHKLSRSFTTVQPSTPAHHTAAAAVTNGMDNRWNMSLHSADFKKNDLKFMWGFLIIYMCSVQI